MPYKNTFDTIVNLHTNNDSLRISIFNILGDTLCINNISNTNSILEILQIAVPFLAVLLAALVPWIIQWQKDKKESQVEIQKWYENLYVELGINVLISKLNGLYYAYEFLHKHFGDEIVKPKEKVSDILKDKITTDFTNALYNVSELLGDQYLYPRLFMVINDYKVDTLITEDSVNDRRILVKKIRSFFIQVKQDLIKIKIKNKGDVRKINFSNDIDFLTKHKEKLLLFNKIVETGFKS
jgi:hypothetical protein